jgi:hypothetical protein
MKITFVKENGAWKIHAIEKPDAGVRGEASSPELPSPADQVALVRGSMRAFGEALARRSMAGCSATTTLSGRRQLLLPVDAPRLKSPRGGRAGSGRCAG